MELSKANIQMEPTKNGYRLSTGREIDSHLGILGISADTKRVRDLYDGYDGIVFSPHLENDVPECRLTRTERAEISTFMIALWQQWGDNNDGA